MKLNIADKNYFKEILCYSQSNLFVFCENEINNYNYTNYTIDKQWIFARGEIPVLLVAHCDRKLNNDKNYNKCEIICEELNTLHIRSRRGVEGTFNFNKNVETWHHKDGIAGDDRCGVFCILKILSLGLKPFVLFTTDEEIGSIGAKEFLNSKYINEIQNMHFYIQIDRGHITSSSLKEFNNKCKYNPFGRDLIYYNSTLNDEFKSAIEKIGKKYKFYNEISTSSTDIVHLSEESNIASVNISSGYFGEHLTTERIVIDEVENTIDLLIELIQFAKKSKQYNVKQ